MRDGKDMIDVDIDGKYILYRKIDLKCHNKFQIVRSVIVKARFLFFSFLFIVYDLVGSDGALVGSLTVTVEAMEAIQSLYD